MKLIVRCRPRGLTWSQFTNLSGTEMYVRMLRNRVEVEVPLEYQVQFVDVRELNQDLSDLRAALVELCEKYTSGLYCVTNVVSPHIGINEKREPVVFTVYLSENSDTDRVTHTLARMELPTKQSGF